MTRDHRQSAGFTLVEIIVVIVILGVIAGLVGPRMVRRDSRQGDQTVARIASMLDAAAGRVAMSSDPVQLEFDEDANELRVLSLVREEGFGQSWDRRVRWRVDPLIPPIELGELGIDEVVVDYRRIRERDWRVRLGGVDAPATVSMALSTEAPARSWRIVLDGASGRAVGGRSEQLATMPAMFVDLDEAGKRDAPW